MFIHLKISVILHAFQSEIVPDDPIPQSAAVQKDPDKNKQGNFEEEPIAGSSRMGQSDRDYVPRQYQRNNMTLAHTLVFFNPIKFHIIVSFMMKLFFDSSEWNTSVVSTTIEEVICGDQIGCIIHQRTVIGATPIMKTQQTTTGTAHITEGVVGRATETDIFTVMVDGQTSAPIIMNQKNRMIVPIAVSV